MSEFQFCVLGSGSSGNCSILKLTSGWVMVDCGFSMKQTKQRMKIHGVTLANIQDIFLTHLDRDHFNPAWCKTIKIHGIRVHMHERHVPRAKNHGLSIENIVPFKKEVSLGCTHVEIVQVEHDALGTMSFIFDNGKQRLGFATDLGHVPPYLLERFINLDIVAFESNYDPSMQLASNRPEFLKDRIMGGGGHLSNGQSCEAVRQIATQSPLTHIVLLHLSRQCNEPRLIRELFETQLPHLASKLTVSSQNQPTGMLRVGSELLETQTVLF